MEQELYRSRNVAKCVKAAYTLFNSNFKRIFLKLWLPFLVLSLLLAWNIKICISLSYMPQKMMEADNFSLVLYVVFFLLSLIAYVWSFGSVFNLLNVKGVKVNVIKLIKLVVVSWLIGLIIAIILGLIIYGMIYYSKPPETGQPVADVAIMMKIMAVVGLMILVISLLLIPFYYAFMQYMMEDNKLRKTFFPAIKTGFRHWGFLFVVYFVLILISIIFISVMMMPVIILSVSQTFSMKSIAMGDPSGLPSYFGWLYFITFSIIYFIMLFFLTWSTFVLYYAYGSIRRNEMDRDLQKKELINKDSTYNT